MIIDGKKDYLKEAIEKEIIARRVSNELLLTGEKRKKKLSKKS